MTFKNYLDLFFFINLSNLSIFLSVINSRQSIGSKLFKKNIHKFLIILHSDAKMISSKRILKNHKCSKVLCT